jgi:hypothetical protein
MCGLTVIGACESAAALRILIDWAYRKGEGEAERGGAYRPAASYSSEEREAYWDGWTMGRNRFLGALVRAR